MRWYDDIVVVIYCYIMLYIVIYNVMYCYILLYIVIHNVMYCYILLYIDRYHQILLDIVILFAIYCYIYLTWLWCIVGCRPSWRSLHHRREPSISFISFIMELSYIQRWICSLQKGQQSNIVVLQIIKIFRYYWEQYSNSNNQQTFGAITEISSRGLGAPQVVQVWNSICQDL